MEFELQLLEEQLDEESFDKVGPHRAVPAGQVGDSLGGAYFIDPVSQVVAVTTVSMIAYRIVDHWLNDKEQGVMIDLRPNPPRISRIAGVPRGFVQLIEEDGSSNVEKHDYSQTDALKDILVAFLSRKAE